MTLADAMAFAITPALIMVLIGSLTFFLVEVFYQGVHDLRIQFIFAMFIMAAVLIGRISMIEGAERAVLFSIPLALVSLLALCQFIKMPPGLAIFSLPVNAGLIALIWWSAHKLTWDCTLDDETVLAEGEGLLQKVGLDGQGEAAAELESPDTVAPKQRTEEDEMLEQLASRSWMSRLADKKRKHTPGVWVVYFSFAALPIFGLGQMFMEGHEFQRERIFRLLVLYVLSALALLLTTSFLGLRKYLRQRKIGMSNSIAGVWLAFGSTMIIVLLAVCSWLPRPGSGVFGDAFKLVSPKHDRSSDWGFGDDGVDEDEGRASQDQMNESDTDMASMAEAARQSNAGNNPDSDNTQSGDSAEKRQSQKGSASKSDKGEKSQGAKDKQSKKNELGGRKKDSKESKARDEQNKSKSEESNSDETQKDQSGKEQQSNNESGDKKNSTDSEQKDQRSETRKSQDRQPPPGQRKQGRSRKKRDERPKDKDQSQEQKADGSKQESQKKQASKPKKQWNFNFSLGGMAALLKIIFQVVVVLVVLLFVVRHWDAIVKALKELWNDFMSLFKGKERITVAEDPIEKTTQPVRQMTFADFNNPFRSQSDAKPDEIVRYSFEAFEAWCRDRGIDREEDQTVYEFAKVVGDQVQDFAVNAKLLAQLYSQAAFAKGSLTRKSLPHLEKVWTAMEG